MLVMDAGTAVDLLLNRPNAFRIWDAWTAADDATHAPELLDVEVLSAVRKLELRAETTSARAEEALADLRRLSIVRHPHARLLPRAWELRANITPYDGLYVALTETLGEQAALLTTDARLARAVRQQSTARVVLVA